MAKARAIPKIVIQSIKQPLAVDECCCGKSARGYQLEHSVIEGDGRGYDPATIPPAFVIVGDGSVKFVDSGL
jgi:hypothetical protein